jgi:magnesium transporter
MSEPPVIEPLAQEQGVIDCGIYAGGRRVGSCAIDQIAESLQQSGRFIWLGLYEPDAALLRRVQQQFKLHDLAIEDALHAHQRPKLEVYDDSLFVVLRTAPEAAPGAEAIDLGETHAFVGHNYVVTVRHGSVRTHVGLRARCEAQPQLLAKGPGFVLYAIMDFVVDQYFPIVDGSEAALATLEDAIFNDKRGGALSSHIYRLKRDLLELKRAISPLVEVCNRLVRFDVSQLIPDDTRVYFRDIYDHVLRLNEMIDNQRELLTAALEANLALIGVAQNDQLKRLAAWAAIIAVPTMIAGVYGMNFEHMPELGWRYGYEAAIGLMLVACGGLFIGFRRSGWL